MKDGDGARLLTWDALSWQPLASLAHLPRMGNEVIHRDLDCFSFSDFFECLEDEFVVKGI